MFMPPFRDVRKLSVLCKQSIIKLIVISIKFIYSNFGSYKSVECQKEILRVQQYLLRFLHPSFLDDIFKSIDPEIEISDKQKCLLLAIFMHSRMKIMLPSFQLPVQDNFYLTYLKKLNYLVSLDLSMVCTDEILQVVGENCPNLESINIVSKVDGSSSKKRRGLNALRLNFFISDRGLESLHKCQKLKRIFMNRMFRSNCGGRKTTHVGIGKLLTNLNKLEYVNYQEMGLVLEKMETTSRLKLVHLQDYHANPEHISLFNTMCPHLTGLSLCAPPSGETLLASQCLKRLSQTSIQLSSLDLNFFSFDDSMINYLQLKGESLTYLSLLHGSLITTKSLIYIGKFCINIRSLQIHFLKDDYNAVCDISNFQDHNFFRHLENFNLTGISWEPLIIFTLVLINAKELKSLKLLNKDYQKDVDYSIKYLLHKNPFFYLKEVSFYEGFSMSMETLSMFILSCKNLVNLSLIDHEGMQEFIDHFNSAHNFDIHVNLTR